MHVRSLNYFLNKIPCFNKCTCYCYVLCVFSSSFFSCFGAGGGGGDDNDFRFRPILHSVTPFLFLSRLTFLTLKGLLGCICSNDWLKQYKIFPQIQRIFSSFRHAKYTPFSPYTERGSQKDLSIVHSLHCQANGRTGPYVNYVYLFTKVVSNLLSEF